MPPNPSHEPCTLVIILVPNGPGTSTPATGHGMHRRAQRPRAGEGHHTPYHYIPEPETYYLVVTFGVVVSWRSWYWRRSCGARDLGVGEEVVLDHNLDLASFNDGGVREKEMDGSFGVVGIAYSDDRAEGLGHEAEYEVQIGTGRGGGFRRWWRER